MKKIVIFGNSGSGKSTLAKKLCEKEKLSHLDLDTIAWKVTSPPERQLVSESKYEIDSFLQLNKAWVIEGCYADLLEIVLSQSSEIIFLNLPVEACIKNAKGRPWEPHKYQSKKAQDANLNMLIEWISQYPNRTDTFSKVAHEDIFNNYKGVKTTWSNNQP